MIRSEQPSDKKNIESLIAKLKSNWSYTSDLRKSNAQNMGMSLVYQSDNGEISGYICCADALNKDIRCIILAGIFADNDDIFKDMLEELKKISTQKGYDVILALDHCSELYDKYGFTDAMKEALCPPDNNEGLVKLEFCMFRLDNSSEPFFTFAEYPREMGIDYCLPQRTVHSVISESDYPRFVYKTRFFTRLLLHMPFIVVSVLALIYLFRTGDTKYVRPLMASLILLGVSIGRPIYFTVKHCKKLLAEGKASENKWVCFYDSHFVIADMQYGGGRFYYYNSYEYVYLKRGYIFIGNRTNGEDTLSGIYISTAAVENKDEFIEFIRQKFSSAKFRF